MAGEQGRQAGERAREKEWVREEREEAPQQQQQQALEEGREQAEVPSLVFVLLT